MLTSIHVMSMFRQLTETSFSNSSNGSRENLSPIDKFSDAIIYVNYGRKYFYEK